MPPPLAPNARKNRSCMLWVLAMIGFCFLIVLIIIVGLNIGVNPTVAKNSTPTPHTGNSSPTTVTRNSTPLPGGVGITTEPGGENIGISDGTFAFDTNRIDGIVKQQGSEDLKNGETANALVMWQQAIALDSNDAEVLIYQEDQQVLTTHKPYITFIVATTLTGSASALSNGRDNLQGAYVAQKEYNDGSKLKNGTMVRLLIANVGSQSGYATTIAQQIVQTTKADPTIVGVMGWPTSSYALNAAPILAQAQIPMVSPTASSDALTGISPYFFRVVPSNRTQAIAGALYAENTLHVKRAAIFTDPTDEYSSTLATDFSQKFIADGNQIVATENYKVGNHAALPGLLQNALSANPDVIYFAGSSDDMGVLLTDLPANPSVQLMGGDALYELNGYPSSARAGFERLHFTAFAYPDEWQYQHLPQPPFFASYAQDFDPTHQHTGSPYGYNRPDNDVILSYDAMVTLLQASNIAMTGSTISLQPGFAWSNLTGITSSQKGDNAPFTPDDLQKSLAKITGSQAIQGMSGQISFGSNGDPLNKAIVILYIDSNGDIHLIPENGIQQGCFLLGSPSCNNT